MPDLSGQRVWLTGASQGIGRAVALELADRGAVTVLTARNEEHLEELRTAVETRGGKAMVKPGDVTDLDRMRQIGAEIEAELGAVDILIANAGTHLESAPESFDSTGYLELMRINYGGMLHCVEAVVDGMIERRSGRIVGVASLAGYRGVPKAAAYSASKGAVINFLQSMRFHLADHNVGVTIVNPGFVRTPLTDRNDFHMPFLMEADRAARVMCDGIARGRAELSFPFPFSTTIALMRIIPHPIYNRIMARVWKRLKGS
jgi:short-subunit dehydrogenase